MFKKIFNYLLGYLWCGKCLSPSPPSLKSCISKILIDRWKGAKTSSDFVVMTRSRNDSQKTISLSHLNVKRSSLAYCFLYCKHSLVIKYSLEWAHSILKGYKDWLKGIPSKDYWRAYTESASLNHWVSVGFPSSRFVWSSAMYVWFLVGWNGNL